MKAAAAVLALVFAVLIGIAGVQAVECFRADLVVHAQRVQA